MARSPQFSGGTIMATRLKGMLNERRSDANIVVEILNAAWTGAKKTEIVYNVNLNFKQVQKYLDFLDGKGLIATDVSSGGKKIFRSTERGKEFVKRYKETVKLLTLKKEKALLLMFLLLLPCFAVCANVLAENYAVGVKNGWWVKYDVTVTGPAPGPQVITWMKVEILEVFGENVTLRLTSHKQNGNETYQTITFDLAATGTAGYSFVVPANLSVGDYVNLGGDVRSISGETTQVCAGVNRTVIHTAFSDSGDTYSYYFDKRTGVAMEIFEVSGSWSSDVVAKDTNIWGSVSSGLDWRLWIVAIVVIVVIIAILASTLRRRKTRHRRKHVG